MATDSIELLRGIRTGLITQIDDLQVLINHAGSPAEHATLLSAQQSIRDAIGDIQKAMTECYRGNK
jgi:hypothetical protein